MTGNCKYYKQERYVSFDSGQTWSGTGEYSQGALIESASTDCGFVPPTPIYEWRNITPTSDPNTYICDDCGDVPPTPHDYSNDYLTIRALGAGNVYWSGSTTSNTLSYSRDSGSTWSSPSTSITISVNSGDAVLFKGECIPISSYPIYGIGTFSGTTSSFNIEGNAMSLLYSDNFRGQTSLSGKYQAFYHLFSSCTSLVNAENLSLPATTLEYDCYCGMFDGCTSLETAPQLPATTLAELCYQNMFADCSNLQTAPTLPATTLARNCYSSMFAYCRNLSSITCLATDISADECTDYWVYGVKSTGTFTTPSSTDWASIYIRNRYNAIPNGWTRINV